MPKTDRDACSVSSSGPPYSDLTTVNVPPGTVCWTPRMAQTAAFAKAHLLFVVFLCLRNGLGRLGFDGIHLHGVCVRHLLELLPPLLYRCP